MLRNHFLADESIFFKIVGFLEAAGWAAFSIYFPVYLRDFRFSGFQIGMIAATPAIAGIFSGMIWGSFSDYIGRRRPFMIQSALSASILIFLTTLVSSFEWFLLLGLLRGFLMPVLEGLTVTNLFSLYDRSKMGRVFGSYAMCKSIGWAISAMITGAVSQLFGLRAALYLSSLIFLSLTIAILKIPERAENSFPTEFRSLKDFSFLEVIFNVLREPRILFFLLASLPLYLAINAAAIFFPIYLKTVGATPFLIGAIFTVPAFLEILVFLKVGEIADAAGGKRSLLLLSSIAYLLLFLFIGNLRDPLLLFLAYLVFEPIAWPPLFTASSALISEILPPQRWATGQTLYRLWAWSLSPVLGYLIGGWISDALGMASMFIFMSVFIALSCVLFTRIKSC